MTLVLAIVALGLLIVVHETGHYVVARLCGMKVERFSIGFGPAIIKWKRGGTQFQIAPIPFGGFVQITGMNPHEEFDADDPSVYPNRPAILRFLTIFAGPFTNVICSSILAFIVVVGAGAESGNSQVTLVSPGSPAEGNLLPGDVILTIDGEAVPHRDVSERIKKSEGKTLTLTVRRNGGVEKMVVTPRKLEGADWRLGITLVAEGRKKVGLPVAAWEALRYPVDKSGQILGGLADVITGKAALVVIGPVGMTSTIREELRAGWVRGLEFLALLNVYLGLFNLLPLPALDGGRLVFLSYELATRRRPNPKVEAAVHMAGFVVLLVVMVLVLFKDIKSAVG